jgi:hypothetical protein
MTLFDWAETAAATLPPHEVRAERKPAVRDAVIFGRKADGSTSTYLRRDWTEGEVERLREMNDEGKSSDEMAEILKRTVGSIEAALDRYIRRRKRKHNGVVWNDANRARLVKMYVEDKMTPSDIAHSDHLSGAPPLLHQTSDRRRPGSPVHVLPYDVLVRLDRQSLVRPL